VAGAAWKASERLVGRKLGSWWADDEDAFVRAPVSGGWPKKRSHGDLVANTDVDVDTNTQILAHRFVTTWSVDVKRRVKGSAGKEWHLEQLLSARKHPIIKWWADVTAIAARRGTMRMLIFTKAKRQYCLMFGEPEMNYLLGNIVMAASGDVGEDRLERLVGLHLVLRGRSGERLFIFDFDAFLKAIPARVLGGLDDGSAQGAEAKAKARLRKASAENNSEEGS